ncbi:TPA: site-specific integrase [Candidatus Uhrbacteria bacterium]|nr:site-specific integrase [Candidatus Uhrbacteria bacterium]
MRMTMAARKIDGFWYIDFRFNRTRYRKKSPENSRRGAEAYEHTLVQTLLSGQSLNDTQAKQKERTFSEFTHEWFKIYVLTNNKLSEQQSKEAILRLHLTPYFGKMKLKEITSRAIEQFKRAQQADGFHPKTINNQIAVISKILHSAVEWGDLENIPVMKRLKVPTKKIRFLNEGEYKNILLDQGEPFWNRMVTVAIFTGMRMGELFGLQWEDIDFEQHLLHVRRSIVRGELTTPKNHQSRIIPIAKNLDDLLYRFRQKRGLVFDQANGQPITPRQAVCGLWRMCKRSGIEKIGWHVLRHTFASHLVMRGVPIRHVQQLLGHSSIVMTERYSHLAPGVLHDAVAVLELTNGNFGQYVGSKNPKVLLPI